MTTAERLAVLETKQIEDRVKLVSIEKKLDQLLDLRAKGAGAFWLASALLGTGIVGFLGSVFGWFKH